MNYHPKMCYDYELFCCPLTTFWQLKGHTYTDQLDYMYMKTTNRLQCAIFVVTCQTETPKMGSCGKNGPPSTILSFS